jgi:hypothetical protein
MIENEWQLKMTQDWVEKLKREIDKIIDANMVDKSLLEEDLIARACYDGLVSKYRELMQEVDEYNNGIQGIKTFKGAEK